MLIITGAYSPGSYSWDIGRAIRELFQCLPTEKPYLQSEITLK